MKTLKFIVGSIKATKTMAKGVIRADKEQIYDGAHEMNNAIREYIKD